MYSGMAFFPTKTHKAAPVKNEVDFISKLPEFVKILVVWARYVSGVDELNTQQAFAAPRPPP